MVNNKITKEKLSLKEQLDESMNLNEQQATQIMKQKKQIERLILQTETLQLQNKELQNSETQ